MSDVAWLFVAFMAVWVAIGVYLFSISSRQKALDQRLKELDR
jgi:CcmD family protein